MTYQGGALLTSVEAQGVYLGSAWSTNSALQSQSQQTDQFLSALANGPYMDMLNNAGYGVGRGSASAGAVDNVSISSTLSDAQIQSDLKTMISAGQVQAPDANRLYMVYVEPGVEVTMGSANSKTSFLGYHGAFNDNGTDIHYAVMVYPGTPNPSSGSQGFASDFDQLTSVSSHELAEAVTDPNVNYKTLGWYDYQLNGEIGDLAEGHESTITGANGTQYVVQDVVNQNDQVISPTSGSTGGGSTGGGSTGGGSTGGGTGQPSPGSLTAPTVTASALSTTAAELSWNAVSGAQSYAIYQVNNGHNVLLGSVNSSTTSVEVTGLTPGATESFVVAAVNATSVADSSVVSVTMPTPPAQVTVTAPQVSAHAASSTSVVLSWNAESQATGYNIYWSNGYQVQFLGTVSGSSSSVTITGLRPGSGSYFLVEAFNNTSRADSQWVYVVTPYYSAGGSTGFGAYAGHHSQSGGTGSSTSLAVSANEWGGGWGRERF